MIMAESLSSQNHVWKVILYSSFPFSFSKKKNTWIIKDSCCFDRRTIMHLSDQLKVRKNTENFIDDGDKSGDCKYLSFNDRCNMACYIAEAETNFWDLSRLFLKVLPLSPSGEGVKRSLFFKDFHCVVLIFVDYCILIC